MKEFVRSLLAAGDHQRTASPAGTKAGGGASPQSARVMAKGGEPAPEGTRPEFDYPVVLHGSSEHFRVFVDPALGSAGVTIAKRVLERCEADLQATANYFDGVAVSGPFNVIIAQLPAGGAYHYGCSGIDIYCDCHLDPPNGDFTEFLNVAELVEVFSEAQGGGWQCGQSNGEGLSRVLATELYPDQLTDFATAHYWLDTPGRPDFVRQNDNSDRNPIANGCAVLFLNYLHRQLGFNWKEIIATRSTTLNEAFRALTGKDDGFEPFRALMETRFPMGQLSGLGNDNPFDLTAAPPGWTDWESLGGLLVSNPRAIAPLANRLELFAAGADHALWHGLWDGAGWHSLEPMGGIVTNGPAVVSAGPSAIDVFCVGADQAIWHWKQIDSQWIGPEWLGGAAFSAPKAVRSGGDRLEILALGADSAIWRNAWDGKSWSGWQSLGGFFQSDPEAVSRTPDTVDIFALGRDHDLRHRARDGSTWADWEPLKRSLISPPRAVARGPNLIDVFGVGEDHAVWHCAWTQNGWQPWESLGGQICSPLEVVGRGADRLDIFGISLDNGLQTRRWAEGQWGPWTSLGGSAFSAISAVAWSPNRLDVFCVGFNSSLFHIAWS